MAHLPFALVAVATTVVLFRPWIAGGLPGGVDSGFLYSTLPLFSIYGATSFTVWLPIPFGQVQQYSIYWFLAMLMVLTRSAVVTYDVVAIALALATLAIVYGCTFWLTRNRLAGGVAAALYATSPIVVTQWLDGHLDMQSSIALGPLAVWMVLVVIRTGSRTAALALGLCASALLLLTTGQAAYWLLPIATLGVVEVVRVVRHDRGVLGRTAKGLAIATTTFVLASAVQLVPLLAGSKAPFLDASSSFYIESLAVHAKYSLSLVSNVLGMPREAWLPAGLHMGAVPFNSIWYGAYVAMVLVLAASAVRTRQRALAITLLGLALCCGSSRAARTASSRCRTGSSTTPCPTSSSSACRTAGSWCRRSPSRWRPGSACRGSSSGPRPLAGDPARSAAPRVAVRSSPPSRWSSRWPGSPSSRRAGSSRGACRPPRCPRPTPPRTPHCATSPATGGC